jgi:putative transposase
VGAICKYRDQGKYKLHGFVLMPDHFHVLLTPGPEVTIERAVQLVKGGSARQIGLLLDYKFPIWQRGFSDHRIRDWQDYQTHMRYLEQNPAKRRLVASAAEYRWSSMSGDYVMDDVPQGLKLPGGVGERHG